jgi:Sporulation initiation factor Spo0A C terminal.
MGHDEIEDVRLEQYVTKVMLEMGVPAHLKGYHYLRSSIIMAEEDMEVVGSVTKLLYPEIAKKYKTTEQKVERAIRNAIEVSWLRGNACIFEELFGYSALTGTGRPTNSEYIAQIADKISLDMRSEMIRAV